MLDAKRIQEDAKITAELICRKNYLTLSPLVVETKNKYQIQQVVKGMIFVAVDVDYEHNKVILTPIHE